MSGTQSSTMVHIGRFFLIINKCFNYFLSSTGVSHPKELSNDVAPQPKETSTLNMLKVKITFSCT